MSSSSGPLTEELQCSICLDVFTDPVTTPCGHNFCKTCLNKHWDNSQTCSCPYCKETFSQRPDLKINITLREVADHYKKKSPEEKNEILCDFCEERKLKALKSCLVCQSSYCETHLESHLKVAERERQRENKWLTMGGLLVQKVKICYSYRRTDTQNECASQHNF
uniref:RING-type domain-containing protein n=1 Tax=Cyprinus carpio TaxID=7962 RepID=A0A8C2HQU9_CYPCA